MEALKKLKQTIETAKAEIKETGKKALDEAFQELLNKFPDVKGIAWHQYTPYFNDGDPCTFSIGERNLIFTKEFFKKNELLTGYVNHSMVIDECNEDELDDAKNDALVAVSVFDTKNKEVKAANDMLNEIFSVDREIFEIAFGDHTVILATCEGYEIEDYEHD